MSRSIVLDADTVEVRESDLPGLVEPGLAQHLVNIVDEGVTYTIRLIGAREFARLRKRYVRQQFNPRTHQREDQPLTDEDAKAFEEEALAAVLVDWSGITNSRTGAPVPCEPAAKLHLPEPIRGALMYVASMGLTRTVEDRQASFRGAARVGDVVADRGAA